VKVGTSLDLNILYFSMFSTRSRLLEKWMSVLHVLMVACKFSVRKDVENAKVARPTVNHLREA
jgi:hypothetical protein